MVSGRLFRMGFETVHQGSGSQAPVQGGTWGQTRTSPWWWEEWRYRHRLAANGHRLVSMIRMYSGSLNSVSPCIRPQAVPHGARLGHLDIGSTQPGKGVQDRCPGSVLFFLSFFFSGSVLFKQLGLSQRWGSFGRGVRGDVTGIF